MTSDSTVHPHVFKHQITSYQGYLDSAKKIGGMLAPTLIAQLAAQRNTTQTPVQRRSK